MKRGKKILSASLSIALFFGQTVFAYSAEINFWRDRRASLPMPPSTLALPNLPPVSKLLGSSSTNSSVQSPARLDALSAALVPYGSVKAIQSARSTAPIVVHVQDIHRNFEAQSNISNALQQLLIGHQVDAIAVEGEHDVVELKAFQNFSDSSAVERAAKYFLKSGELTGAAQAVMTTRPSTVSTLNGIDDEQLHRSNVSAYLKARADQSKARKLVQKESLKLIQLKKSHLNPLLKEFDDHVGRYDAASEPLAEFFVELKKYSQQLHLQLQPDLESFDTALRLENNLNVEKIETARRAIVENLATKLSPAEAADLNATAIEYRLGKIGATDFYQRFDSICDRHHVPAVFMSPLKNYLAYISLCERLDGEKITGAVTRLQKEIYERLIQHPEERDLIERGRLLSLERKLVEFGLSRQEWDEREINPASPDFRPFVDFYRVAIARDAAMSTNISQLLDTRKPKVLVVITGGFHQRGIVESLKDKATLIEFTPRLSKADVIDGSAYLSAFAQEESPLSELFTGKKLFLSPPSMQDPAAVAYVTGALASQKQPNEFERRVQELSAEAAKMNPTLDVKPNELKVSAREFVVDISMDQTGSVERVETRKTLFGRLNGLIKRSNPNNHVPKTNIYNRRDINVGFGYVGFGVLRRWINLGSGFLRRWKPSRMWGWPRAVVFILGAAGAMCLSSLYSDSSTPFFLIIGIVTPFSLLYGPDPVVRIVKEGDKEFLLLTNREGFEIRLPRRTDTKALVVEHAGATVSVQRHSINFYDGKNLLQGMWFAGQGWTWILNQQGVKEPPKDLIDVQQSPTEMLIKSPDGALLFQGVPDNGFWSWKNGELEAARYKQQLEDHVPDLEEVLHDGQLNKNSFRLNIGGYSGRMRLSTSLYDMLIDMAQILVRDHREGKNIGLFGDASSGKNTAVYVLAALLAQPVRVMSFNTSTNEYDIRWTTNLGVTESGTVEEVPAPIYDAARLDQWIICDEITRVGNAAVLSTLDSLMSMGRDGDIIAGKHFALFGLWNPPGGLQRGQRITAADVRRRFSAVLSKNPTPDEELLNVMETVYWAAPAEIHGNETSRQQFEKLARAVVNLSGLIRDWSKTSEGLQNKVPALDPRKINRLLKHLLYFPQDIKFIRDVFEMDYSLDILPPSSRDIVEKKLYGPGGFFELAFKSAWKNDSAHRFMNPETGELNADPGWPKIDEEKGTVTFGTAESGQVVLSLGKLPRNQAWVNEYPNTPDNRLMLSLLAKDLSLQFDFGMLGEVGSGKTTIIHFLLDALLRWDVVYSPQVTGKFGGGNILGKISLKNGRTVYPPSPTSVSAVTNRPIFFDEFDKARPDAWAALNNYLQFGFFMATGGQLVRRGPQSRVIMAGNLNENISAEFASRMRFHVRPRLTENQVVELLKKERDAMRESFKEKKETWYNVPNEDLEALGQAYAKVWEAKDKHAHGYVLDVGILKRHINSMAKNPTYALHLREKLANDLLLGDPEAKSVIDECLKPLASIELRVRAEWNAHQLNVWPPIGERLAMFLVHATKSTGRTVAPDVINEMLKKIRDASELFEDETKTVAELKTLLGVAWSDAEILEAMKTSGLQEALTSIQKPKPVKIEEEWPLWLHDLNETFSSLFEHVKSGVTALLPQEQTKPRFLSDDELKAQGFPHSHSPIPGRKGFAFGEIVGMPSVSSDGREMLVLDRFVTKKDHPDTNVSETREFSRLTLLQWTQSGWSYRAVLAEEWEYPDSASEQRWKEITAAVLMPDGHVALVLEHSKLIESLILMDNGVTPVLSIEPLWEFNGTQLGAPAFSPDGKLVLITQGDSLHLIDRERKIDFPLKGATDVNPFFEFDSSKMSFLHTPNFSEDGTWIGIFGKSGKGRELFAANLNLDRDTQGRLIKASVSSVRPLSDWNDVDVPPVPYVGRAFMSRQGNKWRVERPPRFYSLPELRGQNFPMDQKRSMDGKFEWGRIMGMPSVSSKGNLMLVTDEQDDGKTRVSLFRWKDENSRWEFVKVLAREGEDRPGAQEPWRWLMGAVFTPDDKIAYVEIDRISVERIDLETHELSGELSEIVARTNGTISIPHFWKNGKAFLVEMSEINRLGKWVAEYEYNADGPFNFKQRFPDGTSLRSLIDDEHQSKEIREADHPAIPYRNGSRMSRKGSDWLVTRPEIPRLAVASEKENSDDWFTSEELQAQNFPKDGGPRGDGKQFGKILGLPSMSPDRELLLTVQEEMTGSTRVTSVVLQQWDETQHGWMYVGIVALQGSWMHKRMWKEIKFASFDDKANIMIMERAGQMMRLTWKDRQNLELNDAEWQTTVEDAVGQPRFSSDGKLMMITCRTSLGDQIYVYRTGDWVVTSNTAYLTAGQPGESLLGVDGILSVPQNSPTFAEDNQSIFIVGIHQGEKRVFHARIKDGKIFDGKLVDSLPPMDHAPVPYLYGPMSRSDVKWVAKKSKSSTPSVAPVSSDPKYFTLDELERQEFPLDDRPINGGNGLHFGKIIGLPTLGAGKKQMLVLDEFQGKRRVIRLVLTSDEKWLFKEVVASEGDTSLGRSWKKIISASFNNRNDIFIMEQGGDLYSTSMGHDAKFVHSFPTTYGTPRFSPSGKKMLLSTSDHRVFIYDVNNWNAPDFIRTSSFPSELVDSDKRLLVLLQDTPVFGPDDETIFLFGRTGQIYQAKINASGWIQSEQPLAQPVPEIVPVPYLYGTMTRRGDQWLVERGKAETKETEKEKTEKAAAETAKTGTEIISPILVDLDQLFGEVVGGIPVQVEEAKYESLRALIGAFADSVKAAAQRVIALEKRTVVGVAVPAVSAERKAIPVFAPKTGDEFIFRQLKHVAALQSNTVKKVLHVSVSANGTLALVTVLTDVPQLFLFKRDVQNGALLPEPWHISDGVTDHGGRFVPGDAAVEFVTPDENGTKYLYRIEINDGQPVAGSLSTRGHHGKDIGQGHELDLTMGPPVWITENEGYAWLIQSDKTLALWKVEKGPGSKFIVPKEQIDTALELRSKARVNPNEWFANDPPLIRGDKIILPLNNHKGEMQYFELSDSPYRRIDDISGLKLPEGNISGVATPFGEHGWIFPVEEQKIMAGNSVESTSHLMMLPDAEMVAPAKLQPTVVKGAPATADQISISSGKPGVLGIPPFTVAKVHHIAISPDGKSALVTVQATFGKNVLLIYKRDPVTGELSDRKYVAQGIYKSGAQFKPGKQQITFLIGDEQTQNSTLHGMEFENGEPKPGASKDFGDSFVDLSDGTRFTLHHVAPTWMSVAEGLVWGWKAGLTLSLLRVDAQDLSVFEELGTLSQIINMAGIGNAEPLSAPIAFGNKFILPMHKPNVGTIYLESTDLKTWTKSDEFSNIELAANEFIDSVPTSDGNNGWVFVRETEQKRAGAPSHRSHVVMVKNRATTAAPPSINDTLGYPQPGDLLTVPRSSGAALQIKIKTITNVTISPSQEKALVTVEEPSGGRGLLLYRRDPTSGRVESPTFINNGISFHGGHFVEENKVQYVQGKTRLHQSEIQNNQAITWSTILREGDDLGKGYKLNLTLGPPTWHSETDGLTITDPNKDQVVVRVKRNNLGAIEYSSSLLLKLADSAGLDPHQWIPTHNPFDLGNELLVTFMNSLGSQRTFLLGQQGAREITGLLQHTGLIDAGFASGTYPTPIGRDTLIYIVRGKLEKPDGTTVEIERVIERKINAARIAATSVTTVGAKNISPQPTEPKIIPSSVKTLKSSGDLAEVMAERAKHVAASNNAVPAAEKERLKALVEPIIQAKTPHLSHHLLELSPLISNDGKIFWIENQIQMVDVGNTSSPDYQEGQRTYVLKRADLTSELPAVTREAISFKTIKLNRKEIGLIVQDVSVPFKPGTILTIKNKNVIEKVEIGAVEFLTGDPKGQYYLLGFKTVANHSYLVRCEVGKLEGTLIDSNAYPITPTIDGAGKNIFLVGDEGTNPHTATKLAYVYKHSLNDNTTYRTHLTGNREIRSDIHLPDFAKRAGAPYSPDEGRLFAWASLMDGKKFFDRVLVELRLTKNENDWEYSKSLLHGKDLARAFKLRSESWFPTSVPLPIGDGRWIVTFRQKRGAKRTFVFDWDHPEKFVELKGLLAAFDKAKIVGYPTPFGPNQLLYVLELADGTRHCKVATFATSETSTLQKISAATEDFVADAIDFSLDELMDAPAVLIPGVQNPKTLVGMIKAVLKNLTAVNVEHSLAWAQSLLANPDVTPENPIDYSKKYPAYDLMVAKGFPVEDRTGFGDLMDVSPNEQWLMMARDVVQPNGDKKDEVRIISRSNHAIGFPLNFSVEHDGKAYFPSASIANGKFVGNDHVLLLMRTRTSSASHITVLARIDWANKSCSAIKVLGNEPTKFGRVEAVSPQGDVVAVSVDLKTHLSILNVATGELTEPLPLDAELDHLPSPVKHNVKVFDVHFTPDNRRLWVNSQGYWVSFSIERKSDRLSLTDLRIEMEAPYDRAQKLLREGMLASVHNVELIFKPSLPDVDYWATHDHYIEVDAPYFSVRDHSVVDVSYDRTAALLKPSKDKHLQLWRYDRNPITLAGETTTDGIKHNLENWQSAIFEKNNVIIVGIKGANGKIRNFRADVQWDSMRVLLVPVDFNAMPEARDLTVRSVSPDSKTFIASSITPSGEKLLYVGSRTQQFSVIDSGTLPGTDIPGGDVVDAFITADGKRIWMSLKDGRQVSFYIQRQGGKISPVNGRIEPSIPPHFRIVRSLPAGLLVEDTRSPSAPMKLLVPSSRNTTVVATTPDKSPIKFVSHAMGIPVNENGIVLDATRDGSAYLVRVGQSTLMYASSKFTWELKNIPTASKGDVDVQEALFISHDLILARIIDRTSKDSFALLKVTSDRVEWLKDISTDLIDNTLVSVSPKGDFVFLQTPSGKFVLAHLIPDRLEPVKTFEKGDRIGNSFITWNLVHDILWETDSRIWFHLDDTGQYYSVDFVNGNAVGTPRFLFDLKIADVIPGHPHGAKWIAPKVAQLLSHGAFVANTQSVAPTNHNERLVMQLTPASPLQWVQFPLIEELASSLGELVDVSPNGTHLLVASSDGISMVSRNATVLLKNIDADGEWLDVIEAKFVTDKIILAKTHKVADQGILWGTFEMDDMGRVTWKNLVQTGPLFTLVSVAPNEKDVLIKMADGTIYDGQFNGRTMSIWTGTQHSKEKHVPGSELTWGNIDVILHAPNGDLWFSMDDSRVYWSADPTGSRPAMKMFSLKKGDPIPGHPQGHTWGDAQVVRVLPDAVVINNRKDGKVERVVLQMTNPSAMLLTPSTNAIKVIPKLEQAKRVIEASTDQATQALIRLLETLIEIYEPQPEEETANTSDAVATTAEIQPASEGSTINGPISGFAPIAGKLGKEILNVMGAPLHRTRGPGLLLAGTTKSESGELRLHTQAVERFGDALLDIARSNQSVPKKVREDLLGPLALYDVGYLQGRGATARLSTEEIQSLISYLEERIGNDVQAKKLSFSEAVLLTQHLTQMLGEPVNLISIQHLVLIARAKDAKEIESAIRKTAPSTEIVLLIDQAEQKTFKPLAGAFADRKISFVALPNLFANEQLDFGAFESEMKKLLTTRNAQEVVVSYSRKLRMNFADDLETYWKEFGDLKVMMLDDLISSSEASAVKLDTVFSIARRISRQA